MGDIASESKKMTVSKIKKIFLNFVISLVF